MPSVCLRLLKGDISTDGKWCFIIFKVCLSSGGCQPQAGCASARWKRSPLAAASLLRMPATAGFHSACAFRSASVLLAPWPLALPLIPLVFGHWLFGAGTSGDFSYGPHWIAFKQAIWVMAMRDT